MSLTVLSDANVKQILNNLTKDEVETLQAGLRHSLHEYSTGTNNSGAAAINQPKRTVLESSTGTTSLFMPSTSTTGIGMKVVTLAAPPSYTTNECSVPENKDTTPQGAITLMSADGKPFGFLNAEEVTAFRTALASSLLMIRRRKVKTLTVFGTGKQAYWHVRLALILRGNTIKKVHLINRDFNERSTSLMKAFVSFDAATKRREGWFDTTFDLTSLKYVEVDRLLKDYVRAADIIICTTPSTEPLFDHTVLTNTEGRKRARLIIAVGSYKPHMIEVPPEVVKQAIKVHGHGHHFHKRAEEGGVIVVDTLDCVEEAGELKQAGVGPDRTVELGEIVLLENLVPLDVHDDDSPLDSSTDDSSRSSVDLLSTPGDGMSSLAMAFRDSAIEDGSATPTSKSPSRKSSFSLSRKASFSLRSRNSSQGPRERKKKQTEREDQMCSWLSSGNVIYKSVGMGLMDLTVGADLVKIARFKKIGTTIDEF
ncbi:NAD(P)-binding protein [Hyaloscypha bicolor E]|uniref:NAD(P)-binding protein n=1 Tax=Hyaloscypha bicolor E TaxID=1095630 RepID=A0A2J6T848_9HELO|nr:NAD(P)-binding protein [Hyaloscypha bicolor E]PMD59195.1 NAD(P)-binding protein [Hyaloscypha bicolor E]